MMNIKKKLGLTIKSYRKETGLTQEQFAEKAGFAVQTLSSIEAGHNFPSYPVFEKIVETLNVHPAKLFAFDSNIWTIDDPELQHVIIRAFKALDYEKRKIALKLIQALNELED